METKLNTRNILMASSTKQSISLLRFSGKRQPKLPLGINKKKKVVL